MKKAFLSALLLLSATALKADLISFTQPVEPANAFYTQYSINNAGQTSYHHFAPFQVTTTSGTGAAADLVGQNFLAFCVNPIYNTPSAATVFNYDTTGGVLSYNIGGTDYWNVNTSLKYDALKDIFATFATDLLTLDSSSQEFAYLNSAIGFAISEIVLDFDGTLGSLNLNSGLSLIQNGDLSAVSGTALDYYNSVTAAIGNGSGANFTLHSAGQDSEAGQDLVFFAVPEPGSAFLILVAGLGVMLRRRRQQA